MRFRAVVLLSGVLVAAFMLVTDSVAAACGPVDFDSPPSAIWCDVRARTPVLPTPTPTPAVAAVAKPVADKTVRGGDSPENALELSSDFQMMNPGGRVWYKIGADGSHMDVWMTTYGQPGLGFAVYAPNQDLSAPETKPKGVGTYANNDPNTLRWSGGSFTQKGTWYALVTNDSSKPLSFKLESNQSKVDKNCYSYWETFPTTGQYVYWTACH